MLFHIHEVNQRAQHSVNFIQIYMCTWHAVPLCKWNKLEAKLQGEAIDDFRYRSEHSPTAGVCLSQQLFFAVGEFAEAVGYRRRSEDRKSVVSALEFVSTCSLNDKQELLYGRKIFQISCHIFLPFCI